MTTSEQHVEVTTKYVTTVDELADAWAFVMDRIQQVGPDPHIEIKPMWQAPADSMTPLSDDAAWTRRFEVVVSGMVVEGKSDD